MDNGSGISKIGIATKENPKLICFPTLVGQHLSEFFLSDSDSKYYIGHDAINKKGDLTFISPVKKGLIDDWKHMQMVWEYSFNYELKVDPQEHPVLLTEHPTNTKEKREKTIEIFFEKFKVPVFFLANQSVLALYALGKTSGVVLDVGEDSSTATAVYQGYSIKSSTVQSEMGGRLLTDHIKEIFDKRKISLKGKAFREFTQEIKERFCHLPNPYQKNPDIELNQYERNNPVLPDGNELPLGDLRQIIPGILFDYKATIFPSAKRMHELVIDCLSQLDKDMAQGLSSEIAVTGGSSGFLNFKKTLKYRLSQLADQQFPRHRLKIDLIQPLTDNEKIDLTNIKSLTHQKMTQGFNDSYKFKISQAKMDTVPANFLTWVGGSCLASRKLFQSEWIRLADWMEEGPSIIHRFCFY